MKKCLLCNVYKKLDEFSMERRSKDGKRSRCKSCTNEYNKSYASKNKDRISLYQKKWYQNNKDSVRKKMKLYRRTNLHKVNMRAKARRKSDPLYRIRCNLRTRLHSALNGKYKKGSTVKLLGCSIEYFKSHLESMFSEEMKWENYGVHGWHIDHIIPLSSFDLSDNKQLKQACHYTNLQPLWAKDNFRKGASICD